MNRFSMIRKTLQEAANPTLKPKPKLKRRRRTSAQPQPQQPQQRVDNSRFNIDIPGIIEPRIRQKYTEKLRERGFAIIQFLRADYLEHRSFEKNKYLYFVFAQLDNGDYIAFNLWGKINTSVGGMKIITRSDSAIRVRRNYLTKIESKEHQSDSYESIRHWDAPSET